MDSKHVSAAAHGLACAICFMLAFLSAHQYWIVQDMNVLLGKAATLIRSQDATITSLRLKLSQYDGAFCVPPGVHFPSSK